MNSLFHFIRDNHILAIVDVAVAKESTGLNLSHNQLTEVPNNMGDCTSLTSTFLYEYDNTVLKLPTFCVQLVNLTTLTLDYNSLEHFPAVICEMKSLTNLNVSCNDVKSIPPAIGQLTKLQVFWCNNTSLTEIPDEIGNCVELHTFGARGNQIRTLPDSMTELANLRWLTLENNRIESLPEALGRMQSLTHLNMKNNCLTVFPGALELLKRLRFCYLNSNSIRDVSEWHLSSTAHLQQLNIDDNPFPDDHLHFGYFPHIIYGTVSHRKTVSTIERTIAPIDENNLVNVIPPGVEADTDSERSSSEDEDWEHSVNTSDIDPTDESSDDQNDGDVDDEVDYSKMILELSKFAVTFS